MFRRSSSRSPLSLASDLATSRREFLLAGASLAVLPWLSTVSLAKVNRQPKFSADPFQMGIASGDPAPEGMVLWTRLAPKPLELDGGMPPESYEVRWEIASDDSMKEIVQSGTAMATPELGHSVHVEVEGLQPDRWYWYRFSVGDAQSKIGRTRTTPEEHSPCDKLRFAFSSCQHWEYGYFTALGHMANEDLDLALQLGDYIYEYAGNEKRVRSHIGPEITTLADYRRRYAQYHTDENLQAAHARCPWLVVWDDHEFDNNCAGDISEERGVSKEDYLIRRAAAYQAYYENMPLRKTAMPKGPDMTLYRRIPYGNLANFEMLDTRQYRTDQPNGDGLKPQIGAAVDPKGTLLGDKQERWLRAGLKKSASTWNILGQQVMMARVNRKPPLQLFSMDQWPGYEVARQRLIKFLAEHKINNPVVLTGDIHTNWVNNIQLDSESEQNPVVATEFVCTSITSGGDGVQQRDGHDQLMAANPFVKFHNAERGYVSCTITPKTWQSDYQVVEYIERPGAPLVTRASFVVEAGDPGAKPA